jgi:hypothetical protein
MDSCWSLKYCDERVDALAIALDYLHQADHPLNYVTKETNLIWNRPIPAAK